MVSACLSHICTPSSKSELRFSSRFTRCGTLCSNALISSTWARFNVNGLLRCQNEALGAVIAIDDLVGILCNGQPYTQQAVIVSVHFDFVGRNSNLKIR